MCNNNMRAVTYVDQIQAIKEVFIWGGEGESRKGRVLVKRDDTWWKSFIAKSKYV